MNNALIGSHFSFYFYWTSALLALTGFHQTPSTQHPPITIQNLSKHWKLDKYQYFIFSEAPAEKEKNDYLHFQSDRTFTSVTEGVFDAGQWRLDAPAKRIYLSQENEEGTLVLLISALSPHQLVLLIDDPLDSDAKHLKIYFKN